MNKSNNCTDTLFAEEGTYPVFQANQILTSEDLNELRIYLDSQDRLTRTQLIGIGILCGMELKVLYENNNTSLPEGIKLTKGIGVTSEGYLINIPERLLTHYRGYNDPAEYDLFWFKSGKDDSQYPLLELLHDPCDSNDPNLASSPIKNNPSILTDKCLLVYLEIMHNEQTLCYSDTCDSALRSLP